MFERIAPVYDAMNRVMTAGLDQRWRAATVRETVRQGFNLTLVFNPSSIENVTGIANLTFERARVTDPWKIVSWRDESNY